MADNTFTVQTTQEIEAYNSGADKTILQVKAPVGIQLKIRGWGVFFDGTSLTAEPIQVRLMRQGSAGTLTQITPVKLKHIPESIQSSGYQDATVEPAYTDLLDSAEIHPQAGFEVKFPDNEQPIITPESYIAIVVNAQASVNCRAKIICEE